MYQKTKEELELAKIAGKTCSNAFRKVLASVKVGISCQELDTIARQSIEKENAQSSFMTVEGYRWTICTTINNQVVHGIPAKRILKNGDILGVDIGALYGGFHSDMAKTIPVGEISESTSRFLETGLATLKKAIAQAQIGNRIGDISAVIQEGIEKAGYSVVRSLTGHGVGRQLHEEPYVPGVGQKGVGEQILENMVLAIEVIYAQGKGDVKLEKDGWTISTMDGSLGGLFEQTIAVTKNGPIVLTPY